MAVTFRGVDQESRWASAQAPRRDGLHIDALFGQFAGQRALEQQGRCQR
jgi:hypothetical protein